MWNESYLLLHAKCLALHAAGNTDFNSYYSEDDLAFLAAIGCREREFYDFIEDLNDYGAPSASTALLIAAVRRDYFLVVQHATPSTAILLPSDLPTFGDTLEDIAYLPRILAKARAKLRGELDPDIMYGCGGDRNFLLTHGNIHPADFLRHVWAAEDNDAAVAHYIKAHKK
jgi:hypothetical protein